MPDRCTRAAHRGAVQRYLKANVSTVRKWEVEVIAAVMERGLCNAGQFTQGD
jgi:hypothetical protein